MFKLSKLLFIFYSIVDLECIDEVYDAQEEFNFVVSFCLFSYLSHNHNILK